MLFQWHLILSICIEKFHWARWCIDASCPSHPLDTFALWAKSFPHVHILPEIVYFRLWILFISCEPFSFNFTCSYKCHALLQVISHFEHFGFISTFFHAVIAVVDCISIECHSPSLFATFRAPAINFVLCYYRYSIFFFEIFNRVQQHFVTIWVYIICSHCFALVSSIDCFDCQFLRCVSLDTHLASKTWQSLWVDLHSFNPHSSFSVHVFIRSDFPSFGFHHFAIFFLCDISEVSFVQLNTWMWRPKDNRLIFYPRQCFANYVHFSPNVHKFLSLWDSIEFLNPYCGNGPRVHFVWPQYNLSHFVRRYIEPVESISTFGFSLNRRLYVQIYFHGHGFSILFRWYVTSYLCCLLLQQFRNV